MYRETRPSLPCAHLVDQRWHLTCPGARSPVELRILPDGCMDIVVNEHGRAWMFGPTSTYRMVSGGHQFTGLRLKPHTGRSVFHSDPSEWQDQTLDLGAVWPRVHSELPDLTGSAHPPEAVHRQLEALVLQHARERTSAERRVARAVATLQRAPHGAITSLSAQLNWSERQLRRQFQLHVGLNIKTFARILRFQQLTDHLRAQKRHDQPVKVSWAQTAADHGYADQAHLVRETQRMAGLPPTQFVVQL